MVERLKAAIEKARERRANQDGGAAPAALVAGQPGGVGAGRSEQGRWSALPEARVDPDRMARERIVAFGRDTSASVAFDVLRTRLLKACASRGWTRIGVTSPSQSCGKTVVCGNLAFSLARLPGVRTILLDLDLKVPTLARRLGATTDRRAADFLSGRTHAASYLERVGETLALGLNVKRETDSAEILQSEEARAALATMMTEFRPTLAIHDLPPLLTGDDVLAHLGSLDGIILVAAAGQTTAGQISECERLIEDNANFIGVILNKVEDDSESYEYDYEAA